MLPPQVVTADFETYFADDYTLSKMTTEEYVRDLRFKAHCLGLKQGEATWSSPQASCLASEAFKTFFSKAGVICHHAHFDGLIFSHHFDIRPAMWYDTLSMARLLMPHEKHSLSALCARFGLEEKSVPYNEFRGVYNVTGVLYDKLAKGCEHDCTLTETLFNKMVPYVPQDELRIIDTTIRMFTEPALVLDRPLMEWYVAALKERKESLLVQLGVTKKDLASAHRFADILREIGVEPPMKDGKNGPIYAFAKTDDGMRALVDHESDEVGLLAEARIETKSTGTESRAQRLLDMDKRGPLAVYLNYCGAHTTRWSGGDSMNWQNFKRIDFGPDGEPVQGVEQRGTCRLAIMASSACSVVVVDSAQIECRLLNWLAGQNDVLEKFRNKIDIYSELASQFYGRQVTKADKPERGTGKQLELSCGYGAGAETIVNTAKLGIYGPPVALSIDEGYRARDLYRSTHPMVKALWKYADEVLATLVRGDGDFYWGPMHVKDKRIGLPNKTWLDYSHLHWRDGEFIIISKRGVSRMYGAKLVENVIQALARVVLSEAMLQILPHYKIVTCSHDEIVYLAKTEEAQSALDFGLQVMKTPPVWCAEIPLDAEGGFDVRYSK